MVHIYMGQESGQIKDIVPRTCRCKATSAALNSPLLLVCSSSGVRGSATSSPKNTPYPRTLLTTGWLSDETSG